MIFSKIDFNDEEPLYLQIENYIKSMIDSNLLVSNGKLPATRELSKLLGVSRNSVITAYENLEEKGVLYTVKGRGTFVAEVKSINEDGWKISWSEKANDYGKLAEKLDIVKSEIPWEKNLISFKSISPDGELFDMEEFKKAFLSRISIEGHKILNYGYAKGYKPLIEYLLKYMNAFFEEYDSVMLDNLESIINEIISNGINYFNALINENEKTSDLKKLS